MRRAAKLALEAVAVILAGLALAVVLLAWRLSSGPLEINFATPFIEEALVDQPVAIEIGSTALQWGGFSRLLTIVARDVRIRTHQGDPIAAIPEISADLSLPWLLRGIIAPTRVDLVGPRLRVLRLENGEFALDVADETAPIVRGPSEIPPGAPPAAEPGLDPLTAMIAALDSPPADTDSPLALLREVTIVDARIVLVDRVLDRRWVAPRAAIALRRTATGVEGEALMDVDLGVRMSRVAIETRYPRQTRQATFSVGFTDITPSDLTRISPVLAPLDAIRSPVSGRVDLVFDPGFAPRSAAFELHSGATLLNLMPLWSSPFTAGAFSVSGSVDLRRGHLVLDDVAVDFGGPVISFGAEFVEQDGMVDGFLAGGLSGLPADLIGSVWPRGFADGGRSWIVQNMRRGRIDSFGISVQLRAPADDLTAVELVTMDGAIVASDMTLTYLEGLPDATGMSASATFDENDMRIAIGGGRLRGLTVLPSDVVITGLNDPLQDIDIDVALAGPIRDTLEIVDHPPLGLAGRIDLDPADTGGETGLRLQFAFPLLADLPIDSIAYSGRATLADAAIDGLRPGYDLAQGTGEIVFDGRGLTAEGEARINGIPARLRWQEPFSGGGGTQLSVQATLTDQQRAQLGLPGIDGLSGTIGVDADYAAGVGGGTIDARLDLAGSSFTLPVLDWTKPAGTAARAELALRLSGERIERIDRFALSGAGLEARGSAALASSGGLSRLTLDRLAVDGQEVAGTLQIAGDGSLDIELTGQRLDISEGFGRSGAEPAEGGGGATASGPQIRLSLDVGTLILGEDAALQAVRGTLSGRPGNWRAIDLAAVPPGGGSVVLRLTPEGGMQRLVLRSDNAGGVLRALEITDTIRGGQIAIDGVSANGTVGPIDGNMVITDFVLRDVPAMARLLQLTSPIGILEAFRTSGLLFSRLEAQISYRAVPEAVVLRDGVASGADLGLTFDGRIDIAGERIDVAGTVAPMNTVNTIVGAIPLLGDILTGGNSGGVLAFTYAVGGRFDDPAVSVNPLSVLAPGIIRRLLFERTPSSG